MKLKRNLALSATFLVFLTGTATAWAVIPDSAGVIHGCRNTLTKALTVIDSPSQSCGLGTTALSWNQQGPQGPSGIAGPTGAVGIPGPSGPVGATGSSGPTGPKGDTGVAGPTGSNGAAGPVGATGNTGAVGPQGIQGTPGPVGPKGDTGSTGAAGANGAIGSVGPAGTQGPVGPAGPNRLPDVYVEPGQGTLGHQVGAGAIQTFRATCSFSFNDANPSGSNVVIGGGYRVVDSSGQTIFADISVSEAGSVRSVTGDNTGATSPYPPFEVTLRNNESFTINVVVYSECFTY